MDASSTVTNDSRIGTSISALIHSGVQSSVNQPLWKTWSELSKKQGKHRTFYGLSKIRQSFEQQQLSEFEDERRTHSMDTIKHGSKEANQLRKEVRKEWKVSSTYEGEWENDMRHGYGIQVYPNGEQYHGQWSCDQPNGFGVYWIPKHGAQNRKSQRNSGLEKCNPHLRPLLKLKRKVSFHGFDAEVPRSCIEGTMTEDEFQSERSEVSQRKLYEGHWAGGVKQGKGTYYYATGDKYEGDWAQDCRHGQGILYYRNGDVYEGQFQFGKQTGFGRLIESKTNHIYEGFWMNGFKEGPGHYLYGSGRHKGRLFVGEWVRNVGRTGYFSDPTESTPSLKDGNAIPEVKLIERDLVLINEIEGIRKERELVRKLTLLSIDDCFESEEQCRRLLSLFESVSTPLKSNGTSDHRFRQHQLDLANLVTLLKHVGLVHVTEQQLRSLLKDLGCFTNSYETILTFLDCAKIYRAIVTQSEP